MSDFRKFMVSINVSDDKMAEMKQAGIPAQQPTHAEMMARRATHAEAAERLGRDALRQERKDRLGDIPDSGRVVFTRDGQDKVSFARVREDAEGLGFVITAVYVEKAPGKSPRFRVWFERGTDAAPLEVAGAMKFHLDAMFNRAYQKVFAFDNRTTDGGFTFNAINAMDEKARRGVRDLRIGEGRMACTLRDDA